MTRLGMWVEDRQVRLFFVALLLVALLTSCGL